MKFFLISDNNDTLMGMRLAGIQGVIAHTRDEVLTELYKVIEDESVAIILITTLCIQTCPEVIADMKLKLRRPLIVEIPDNQNSAKIGETIDAYISEAIGIML